MGRNACVQQQLQTVAEMAENYIYLDLPVYCPHYDICTCLEKRYLIDLAILIEKLAQTRKFE